MKRSVSLFFCLVAALGMLLTGCMAPVKAPAPATQPQLQETLPAPETEAPATVPAETTAPAETETAPAEETAEPTETETAPAEETVPADVEVILPPPEAEEELKEERFTLSFIGDCTIGSQPIQFNVMYSILWFIGEDYSYPFKGVIWAIF